MIDWDKIRARKDAARGPFEELCRGFLNLDGWSTGRTARRLDDALLALREFRDANNQSRNMGDGELILSVRVVADELANQIQAASSDPAQGLDPATIAWVLAGMRCPNRPFCTGCRGCFTITAPNRAIPGEVGAQ